MNRVCITLDQDWATDNLLRDTLALADEYGVNCTVFATGYSELLREIEGHEVGLHPWLINCPTTQIPAIMQWYPEAKGARNHCLATSAQILDAYQESGLVYEGNVFLPGHEGLRPTWRRENLLSIPCVWYDQHWMTEGGLSALDVLKLEGVVVLTFHPIYIEQQDVVRKQFTKVLKKVGTEASTMYEIYQECERAKA